MCDGVTPPSCSTTSTTISQQKNKNKGKTRILPGGRRKGGGGGGEGDYGGGEKLAKINSLFWWGLKVAMKGMKWRKVMAKHRRIHRMNRTMEQRGKGHPPAMMKKAAQRAIMREVAQMIMPNWQPKLNQSRPKGEYIGDI